MYTVSGNNRSYIFRIDHCRRQQESKDVGGGIDMKMFPIVLGAKFDLQPQF